MNTSSNLECADLSALSYQSGAKAPHSKEALQAVVLGGSLVRRGTDLADPDASGTENRLRHFECAMRFVLSIRY